MLISSEVKKKKIQNLKTERMLCKLNGLNAEDQKMQLDTCFEEWKGSLEQVDDVCIMGLNV